MQKSSKTIKNYPSTPNSTKPVLSFLHNYSGMKEGNKPQETEEMIVCGCKALGSVVGVSYTSYDRCTNWVSNREVNTL